MPPPYPPEYGHGPVNYAQQGGGSPLGSADNRIRYVDMVRQQMVSQYQQNVVQPATLTLAQQRSVATQPQFQYGIQGGQQNIARMYQRQATMNRTAYAGAVTGAALGMGAWGLGGAGVAAAGIGATSVAGLALPFAAAAVPMHFVNKGIQNTLERQRYMHSIAGDVEQYRDRLGFRGLSYGQASQLGGNMASSMLKGGEFFTGGQQMRIHKLGLSNDLLSARGRGGDSGTIKQYERNFAELKDTTKDVVKLLQTTIEGGMSVIKELQQGGFGSIRQIKQQVVQAKAFGGMTGLGAQNMMQIGAAGARAAQGTPWSATAMATQYQAGAAQAGFMVQAGGAGAAAVQRAGGIAQAGATMAGFQANVLSSGIGTKMVAYAMRPDGTMDEQRMDRITSGAAGAYEIVAGANQAGYAMGPGGRALFERNKYMAMNQMTAQRREQYTVRAFQAWASQGGRRHVDSKAQAWAFAGMYTNNYRERELVTQNLLAPKNWVQRAAERQAVTQGLQAVARPKAAPQLNRFQEAFGTTMGGIGAGLYGAGALGVGAVQGAAVGVSTAVGDIGAAFAAAGRGIAETYVGGGYRMYGRGDVGDVTQGARRLAGLEAGGPVSAQSQAMYGRMTRAEIENVGRRPGLRPGRTLDLNLDFQEIFNRGTAEQLQYFTQSMRTGLANNTLAAAVQDPSNLRLLGITKDDPRLQYMTADPLAVLNYTARGFAPIYKGANKKADDAMASWEKAYRGTKGDPQNPETQRNMRETMTWMRNMGAEQRDALMQTQGRIRAQLPGHQFSPELSMRWDTYQSLKAEDAKEKTRGGTLTEATMDVRGMEMGVDAKAAQVLGFEQVVRAGEVVRPGTREWRQYRAGAMVAPTGMMAMGGGDVTAQTNIRRQERIYKLARRALKRKDIDDPSDLFTALNETLQGQTDWSTKANTRQRRDIRALAGEMGEEYLEGKGWSLDFQKLVSGQAEAAALPGVALIKQRRARFAATFMAGLPEAQISGVIGQEIKRAFIGGAGAVQLGTKARQILADRAGITPSKLGEVIGEGGEAVASFLMGGEARKAQETKSMMMNRQALNQEIRSINLRLKDNIQADAGKAALTKDKKAELRLQRADLKSQLDTLSMDELGKPGTQVAMQAPTLNYWNNRWTA